MTAGQKHYASVVENIVRRLSALESRGLSRPDFEREFRRQYTFTKAEEEE